MDPPLYNFRAGLTTGELTALAFSTQIAFTLHLKPACHKLGREATSEASELGTHQCESLSGADAMTFVLGISFCL